MGDGFMMRWRGEMYTHNAGEYQFRTNSDDGSLLFIDGNLVVNNDGNHGMRVRSGIATMTVGWHPITVVFYENGGGAGLVVTVRAPGNNMAPWEVLSASTCRAVAPSMTFTVPELPVPPTGDGLYFEAYDVTGSGSAVSLMSIVDTATDNSWNNWTASVSHEALGQAVWYSNDNAFINEIPGFDQGDYYYMRWRGQINIPADGNYTFKTRSDDGSLLLIDGVVVVNNDGNHGMQDREGTVTGLTAGYHDITIVFYEWGGGAGLQVSWKPAGGTYTPLSASVCKAWLPGLYFEAYVWPGRYLRDMQDGVSDTVWPNAGNPIVSHPALGQNVWYNSDNHFISEIPLFDRRDRYMMRWRGQINIHVAGDWTFQTRSDDGSMLYIDGNLVVNNDGNHGMRIRSGTASGLTVGWHDIVMTFYENGGGAGMQVSYSLPGSGAFPEPLSASMCRTLG